MTKPRIVSQELIANLPEIERQFALKYLKEGRWVLDNDPGNDAPGGDHRSQHNEGGS